MFGEEFGPVPLETLQELVEAGSISAADEVRRGSSRGWIPAESVPELGLADAGSVATATRPAPADTPSRKLDEWYCRIMEEEFGPLSFEELVKFAEHEHLGADDVVKLGRDGKWRRVGSIGRLMAVLPYIEAAPTQRARRTEPPKSAEAQKAEQEAAQRAQAAEAILAQANAAYKAAEEQAQAQLAWAGGPQVDRAWWCWIGGVEMGPMDLNRVVSLAYAAQLKPTDYVKNGPLGQYLPASNISGLFAAVQILTAAADARQQARLQAHALLHPPVPTAPSAPTAVPAPTPVSAPVAPAQAATTQSSVPAQTAKTAATPKSDPVVAQIPKAKSNPNVSTQLVSESKPERPAEPAAVEPVPAAPSLASSPTSTANSYASSGFGSSSSMSSMASAAPRPMPAPRPARPKSTLIPDLMEKLQGPQAKGILAAVVAVALVFGWSFLPKSRGADLKHYHTLKALLDEIKAKRQSSPGELASVRTKLEQAGKEVAAYMKDRASRDDFAKQCLLWASRDEIPKMLGAGLEKESPAEVNFETRLKEASYELGLAKRPPIALTQAASPSSD